MRTFSLTIDLLSSPVYGAIHDLSVQGSSFTPYEKPLARFAELLASLGAPGTAFVTGIDLLQPFAAERAAAAQDAGHEIASHSYEHDFRLSKRSSERIREDLHASIDAIREAVGRVPRGFRAPGYVTSTRLLDEIERAGFYWDSSVYPSALLLGARAALFALSNLQNRAPAPSVGHPRAVAAPRDPYRPGTPYAQGSRPLLELPITDAYGAPLTGGALIRLSDRLAERLPAALEPREHLVLSFHALELADAEDVPDRLVSRHRELQVPWRDRERSLHRRLSLLADRRDLMTCSQLVAQLT